MKNSMKIIKNRSDIGAGTRGSDMGIDAMEIAAINRGSHFFRQVPYIEIQTRNESVYSDDRDRCGKRISQVKDQCELLSSAVISTLQESEFPVVISGDHSSAIGTISGIKAAYPDKCLGVIWIDAHADLHSPYTTPSGNLHGMPLAACLGQDNLSCKINEISDYTASYWEQLKAVGVAGAKLDSRHLVYFGVRDTEEPEDLLIASLGIPNYTVSQVRTRGIEICVQDALARLQECDMIYVSFDVDSMDSDQISDGTGTPVPEGFDPSEIVSMTQQLFRCGKVICYEIVEVNPLLDHKGNRMAEVAFDILEQVTREMMEYAPAR
ncbi:arginase [Chitinophaga rhizophila]|uniref:Arginase n=1 Tax=Chitinophaga rhizophila TaxID=2866212 RepID=A0ABS7GKQ9_9BACT|nr:arginase [Chitinophaga rhizophila]MBW8687981.1 arginase [Chitinophaga rhizophila]